MKAAIFTTILALGVLVAILGLALVVNALASEGTGYTVFMHNCEGESSLLGAHVASFRNLDEAQAWADELLRIRYDVALIYALDAPSRLNDLLWVKADGVCYGDYREWGRPS